MVIVAVGERGGTASWLVAGVTTVTVTKAVEQVLRVGVLTSPEVSEVPNQTREEGLVNSLELCALTFS